MDLDSWKPNDIFRRVSIAVCVQLALLIGLILVLALGWPWWLGWPAAVLVGAAAYALAMTLHGRRGRARRR